MSEEVRAARESVLLSLRVAFRGAVRGFAGEGCAFSTATGASVAFFERVFRAKVKPSSSSSYATWILARSPASIVLQCLIPRLSLMRRISARVNANGTYISSLSLAYWLRFYSQSPLSRHCL